MAFRPFWVKDDLLPFRKQKLSKRATPIVARLPRVFTLFSPTVQAPVSLCIARPVSCSNQRAPLGYPAIDELRPKLDKLTEGGHKRIVFVLPDSNKQTSPPAFLAIL